MSLKTAVTFGTGVAVGVGIAWLLERRSKSVVGVVADLVSRWEKLDTDGDGSVSREEFKAAVIELFKDSQALTVEQITNLYDIIAETRARLDTNKDGKISWDELATGLKVALAAASGKAVATTEDLQSALDFSRSAATMGGKLSLKVIRACKLTNLDSGIFGDVSDPFVKVTAGTEQVETSPINNNLNPEWNKQFELKVGPPSNSATELLFEVMNYNRTKAHAPLGTLKLPMTMFKAGKVCHIKEKLVGGGTGELEIEVVFTPA